MGSEMCIRDRCSAFGTGLAWGTMVMDTSTDGVFPELIRYAGDKTDN